MRGFQVEFITAEGTPEAGIDGGGLLKELIVRTSSSKHHRGSGGGSSAFHGCLYLSLCICVYACILCL